MTNSLVLRLAVCVSAASALAWSQAAPDPSTASLEGKVVSQTTGNPLKKTNLLLRPVAGGKTLSAESDDKGAFSFPTVAPGRYTLTGDRTGYAKQPYGVRGNSSPGAVLTLSAGKATKDIVFKLVPNAIVSGRVLDEDGDPMGNSAVVLLRQGYQNGRKQYVQAGSATVGANGEHSASVTAGHYMLACVSTASLAAAAQGASSKPPGDDPEPAYATVFYPRSPDEAGATWVDAAAGAELRGIDFYMTKVRTFRIRGKMGESQGGKASLAVLSPTGTSLASLAPKLTRIQPDGSFEFVGVTPGQWTMRAAGESVVNATRLVITVEDKHISGLTVPLAPMGDFPGSLKVDGSDTVSPKGILLTMESIEFGGKGGEAEAAEDGKFLIKSLLPDRYRVTISRAPAGVYLKSVRYGGQDATDEGADLTSGVTGSIAVVLGADGAEVTGTVAGADGTAMTGVTVALIPNSRRYQLYKSDTTDQSGTFHFQSVPPGDYKLLAWEDVLSGAWYDPDFVKPYESKAEAVSVKENDRKSVALKAIPVEAKSK